MFVCLSDVRPSGDFVIFAIFAFTVLTWPYMGHRYCLLKKIKCSFLEPSSLNICQDQLWWLFFSFLQKLQKSSRVVSGGKTRKSEQVDPFPQCKNVQKYIFLETRALDLRQIDVTDSLFARSAITLDCASEQGCLSVCLFVCLSVCLFTFFFRPLFGPVRARIQLQFHEKSTQ